MARTRKKTAVVSNGVVDYHMVANEGMEAQKPPNGRRARATFFGDRLRERMEEAHLSGAEVARRAKISPRQLNHYVRGDREPSLLVAQKIASCLQVTLESLIDSKSRVRHRDNMTYVALERFYHLCGDLDSDDVSMLVDFAEFAAARRREEAVRHIGMGGSSPSEFLMLVYNVLIPAILRKVRTPKVATEIFHRDDDNLWLLIHITFDEYGRRRGLLDELMAMARNKLKLSKDRVEGREVDGKLLTMDVCLGPAPPPPEISKPTKKRAR